MVEQLENKVMEEVRLVWGKMAIMDLVHSLFQLTVGLIVLAGHIPACNNPTIKYIDYVVNIFIVCMHIHQIYRLCGKHIHSLYAYSWFV